MTITSNMYNGTFTFFRDGEVVATCTANYLLNGNRCNPEYRKAVTIEQMEKLEAN